MGSVGEASVLKPREPILRLSRGRRLNFTKSTWHERHTGTRIDTQQRIMAEQSEQGLSSE